MHVLIIDDEPKARKLLIALIKNNSTVIGNIYEAEDLMQGIKIIKQHQPDVLFLDIEMPEYSGLDIFNYVDHTQYNFDIVFTTAFNEYAVQAFELSAVDYLLKPLNQEKVLAAIDKVYHKRQTKSIDERLKELKNSLLSNNFSKIALPVANGVRFINFDQIILLKAEGMYTRIFIKDECEQLISKPLRHFVDLLSKQPLFFRSHRSFLINLHFIKEYIKKDGGYILMENDQPVSLAKDKKELFLSLAEVI